MMTKNLALALILSLLGQGWAAAAAAAAPASAPAEVAAKSAAFTKLADDYWDAQMELYPLWATFVNYPKHHDRLDDVSAAGRAKERSVLGGLFGRLKALDLATLSAEERVSAEIMEWQIRMSLESQEHKFFQWNVDHMDGPHTWIPTLVELAQPMKDEKDAEALLARMKAMPAYFEAHIANLREGLKDGRVAARVPVEKTIAQLQELIKTPADQTPFAAAAKKLPEQAKAKYLPLIIAAVKSEAFAADEKYLDFLKKEYLPKARVERIGLSSLPQGKQAYGYMVRYHTTVEKSPEELHQVGLEELRAIHARMKTIGKRMGHEGDLASFMEKVRNDPANFFKTREEVLKNAEALVAKAKARLPEYFGILPKTDMVVKPIEEYKEKNDVAARYYQPPDDLSRPGIYFINTYDPPTRPRFSMSSLAVHEGVPGHHMQIAIALEQRGLPTFRRQAGFTAFVEGWALYSEILGEEMGLYEDDLSKVGMLSDQALRASRLVVDTGLHAMNWSRQQAIDFMKANTPMSEHEIVSEVDRYIIWPGQALAYKVGQREILALREELRKKQGGKFDVRAFHDAVLKNGAVPLKTLRRSVLAPAG